MLGKFMHLVSALLIIASLAIVVNIAGAQVVEGGLVSYWTFDETDISGKTVKDRFGSNDGTIAGNPKIVKGKIGQALEFDGDDHVDCGRDDSLLLGDTDLSFGLWCKFANTAGKNYLIGNFSSQNGKYYHIWEQDGKFIWSIDDDVTKSQIQSTTSIQLGKWYHVVGVRQRGKETRLYVNGVLEAKGPDQTGDITSDAPMFFGDRFAGERALEGVIDEVALYSRALSDNEIAQNFKSEIGLAVEPAGKLGLTWGEIKELR